MSENNGHQVNRIPWFCPHKFFGTSIVHVGRQQWIGCAKSSWCTEWNVVDSDQKKSFSTVSACDWKIYRRRCLSHCRRQSNLIWARVRSINSVDFLTSVAFASLNTQTALIKLFGINSFCNEIFKKLNDPTEIHLSYQKNYLLLHKIGMARAIIPTSDTEYKCDGVKLCLRERRAQAPKLTITSNATRRNGMRATKENHANEISVAKLKSRTDDDPINGNIFAYSLRFHYFAINSNFGCENRCRHPPPNCRCDANGIICNTCESHCFTQ